MEERNMIEKTIEIMSEENKGYRCFMICWHTLDKSNKPGSYGIDMRIQINGGRRWNGIMIAT